MHHQLDKTGSLYSNFAVVSVVPRGYVDPKIFPDRISWSIVGDGVDIFFLSIFIVWGTNFSQVVIRYQIKLIHTLVDKNTC